MISTDVQMYKFGKKTIRKHHNVNMNATSKGTEYRHKRRRQKVIRKRNMKFYQWGFELGS